MGYPVEDILNSLKELNEKLATPDPVDLEEIQVVERGVFMLLGMTHHMAKGANVSLNVFFENITFGDFMDEFAEFCYHRVKRELDEMELSQKLKDLGI